MTNSNQTNRQVKNYKNLSHVAAFNHWNTEFTKSDEGHSRLEFLTKAIFSWFYHTIKSYFGRRYPYPTYKSVIGYSIYPLANCTETTLSLASDWATNTQDSIQIANLIKKRESDFTIHLGDIYYVGEKKEVFRNFLPFGNSVWPRGKKGSFALLGNHEIYAKGDAFFETLLPSMGLQQSINKFTGQGVPYFCIENEYWRIIGLDTAYNSVGRILPINGDCHFEK